MTCQKDKGLMMAYIDNELDDEQKRSFEKHLMSCADCRKEVEEFRKLKQITDDLALAEPEDVVWRQYWSGIYNRVERGVGWVLFSVAVILLLIYGGFRIIEAIIKDPTVDKVLKMGLLTLIVGAAILFVSILRERIYFWKKDRYKDIRR